MKFKQDRISGETNWMPKKRDSNYFSRWEFKRNLAGNGSKPRPEYDLPMDGRILLEVLHEHDGHREKMLWMQINE
jgi:hypothetical protein